MTKRAFIQVFNKDSMSPESRLVSEELTIRNIPVVFLTTEEILANKFEGLTSDDLVVGDFTWTKAALTKLGIPLPTPPDYPKCLEHLLNRKIWRSTLGEF